MNALRSFASQVLSVAAGEKGKGTRQGQGPEGSGEESTSGKLSDTLPEVAFE